MIPTSHTGHVKYITDITNYNTDIYGKHLYIHTTDNYDNKNPWLCINQVDFANTDDNKLIDDIRNSRNKAHDNTGNKVRIYALHRKYKGPLPTSQLPLITHHNKAKPSIQQRHTTRPAHTENPTLHKQNTTTMHKLSQTWTYKQTLKK